MYSGLKNSPRGREKCSPFLNVDCSISLNRVLFNSVMALKLRVELTTR